jgi:hypothetical protein
MLIETDEMPDLEPSAIQGSQCRIDSFSHRFVPPNGRI